MKNTYVIILTVLISLSFALTVHAQSNYADYKVDELSDAQILQMVKQAESIGYGDAQLEQMAAARGMSATEIQKLRARVNQLKQSGAVNAAQSTAERSPIPTIAPSQGASSPANSIDPKIFGSALFNNGSISFEPNLRIATPKNYVIGPDDKLLIDLTGDNEAKYELTVSPEGVINLQFVGRVAVGGLTIEQATSKIRTAMAKTYPSLNSGRTSLAVNIGNIRSIKVTLTGNIVRSGTYTLSSLSTVYNALYASGGPSANGSFRNIEVIRNNKVVARIDVYNFLLKGIAQDNIRLQDQDVIHVPVYETRVEMSGQVKQRALFEVLKGETLKDVIGFAGGFTTQAYTAKIKSLQNTDKERRITDIAAADFASYEPKSGDVYFVDAILDRFENRVTIEGAVFRPGEFQLDQGMTLKALIAKAEGLKEDAFLNRGYISRLNADNSMALLSFDVAKVLAGTAKDLVLQREDKIVISSIFDLRDEYRVSINGEVRSAGSFAYAKNMTLEDVIQMAGGFREGATPNRIEISRRVKNSDAKSDSASTAQVFTVNVDPKLKLQDQGFVLEPFDVIAVRSSDGYQIQKQVKLEGEVLFPGLYTIKDKNERISNLIERAGGLTPNAYAEGASLKRPGAEKVNPNDKNAINTGDEEQRKLLNLKRLNEDSLGLSAADELLAQSDLVGIDLVRILDHPLSIHDLIVEDGDVIRVPRLLQTVKVSGSVLNPNNIVYLPGKGFKSYVKGAGGFMQNALKKRAYIKYANGSVAGSGKFLFFNTFPQVKPGAEIFVPKRAEREPMSVQAWVGLGTAVASLGAIIVSLLR